jgi:predicted dehydrogenase
MTHRVTRRRALQIGAGTLGYLFTGPALSVSRVYGASDKIRVAGIGVGGKGSSDIEQAGLVMQVVALCDIDEERLGKRAETWPSAKKYFDYRKLINEMGKEIDAVTVSTADHSHAPAALLAMRAGKHVYCQKPLTHTVHEARMMREVAAKQGVCTQMGNQGSALNGLRRAVELVHAGLLGSVTEAHVWTGKSGSVPPGSAPTRSTRAASRPTTRTTGAAGGNSAPAPWATWPATPPTWRSGL